MALFRLAPACDKVAVSYQSIPLRCTCGDTPFRIEEVGLSSDRELVIHWWCEPCRRVMYTSIPLARCLESCPPPDPQVAEADALFLSSVGIQS